MNILVTGIRIASPGMEQLHGGAEMASWNGCYAKYGSKAAFLTVAFPGLGQVHNKQFLKGIAIAGAFCICSFGFVYLYLYRLASYWTSSSDLSIYFFLLTLITWELSLFDAFSCAIKFRKRDSKRFNTQERVRVTGVDVNKEKFAQVVRMRNLSKTGACLAISREIEKGSLLSLDFESKPKCRGRVIWQRQIDCEDELLVGVEFLVPLAALYLEFSMTGFNPREEKHETNSEFLGSL